MADNLKNIIIDLQKLQNFLTEGLDNILLSNLESLKSVIIRRIRTGKDADGKDFNIYSETKINPTDILDGLKKNRRNPVKAVDFLNEAIEQSRNVSWYQVRESVGLTNKVHNYEFTGEMLQSIGVKLIDKTNGDYKLLIIPRDEVNLDKLIDNEERENEEILEQSEQEIQQTADDIIQDILDDFQNIFE